MKRAWPLIRTLLVTVVILAVGWLVAPRLLGPLTTETEIGSLSFQLEAASGGDIRAYVPVTDWGLSADAYDAPFDIKVEMRSLDREQLIAAAGGDTEVLSTASEQLQDAALRTTLLTALIWALASLTAAVLLTRLAPGLFRRRWQLVVVVAAGLVLLGGSSLLRAALSFNQASFEQPTYFARGSELAGLLAASERERERNSYGSTFERVLRGLSTYLAHSNEKLAPEGRSLFLGSDLHNNVLVLEPLGRIAAGKPIVLAGDFGQRGDDFEISLLAKRIGSLPSEVIAVSGNHDSLPLMRALRREGADVLGESVPMRTYEGLRIAGYPDPLQYDPKQPSIGDRLLSFDDSPEGEQLYAAAERDLLAWFDQLPSSPDVVIIHQNGLAQYLGQTLAERGYERPLTILTGHDHLQHVDRYGPITVVDAGTVGASGLFEIGSQYVGVAELHFDPDEPILRSVDLIRVEPLSGQAAAERVVVDELCPEQASCHYEPGTKKP